MSQQGLPILVKSMAQFLLAQFACAEPGDCHRVDDVSESTALLLVDELRVQGHGIAVHILRENPRDPREIRAERAIELRNRKAAPLLLIVPSGEGHAASSLDNSFQRIPVNLVFTSIESDLRTQLDGSSLAEPLARNVRRMRPRQAEWWAEYLAELCVDPREVAFGMNLWRIGLVPDAGPESWARLERNRLATRAISQPARPTASLDERFTIGGLREGSWRAGLRAFCESAPASLADARSWGRVIAHDRPDLTFDRWLLAEAVEEDIESLQLEPFVRIDGTLDTTCKLQLGGDGQLLLAVPDGGVAPLVVKWRTDPPRVAAIDRWSLEVLPPDDLRSETHEPLATASVKGDKRRCTLKVTVDEDSLSEGSRFVVVLTAIGPNGEVIGLKNGEPALAESQEFQVVSVAEPERRTRRTAAASLPEARLRAALDGMDDLAEDLVSWDLEGQVFGVRLGNRRAVQIRVSNLIVGLQRELTSNPHSAAHFTATASHGVPMSGDALTRVSLTLPDRLKKTRFDFLSALFERRPRDTVESVTWDAELRSLAATYLATYRRALDNADQRSVADLLLLDSLSLTIRRRGGHVKAVVLPPIHPIRLAWVAEYDQTLREWAEALTEVTPRGARGTLVDAALVSRVLPANLPFSLLHTDGDIAYYVEELTYGSGLYVVPGPVDSEAGAESVASVVGLPRAGSSLFASSSMVGERIAGYELSHEPSETIRILSVRPGSGDLLAGALQGRFDEAVGDGETSETVDPRRMEVVCYTDGAGFARPVPGLLNLQSSLRLREFSRRSSHLFPPLSLTVRSTDRLLEDPEPAHLAILQDVGTPGISQSSPVDRVPSFRDLLVPLVTRTLDESGGVAWQSVPATGAPPSGGGSEMTSTHAAHQKAMARFAGMGAGTVPTVQVSLDGDRLAQLRTAHERADWVVGVDRFVGVDLYEGSSGHHISGSYILDYAPDFVEGIGERLTVTTNRRGEVEGILGTAMRELHLDAVDQSVGQILSRLSVVSGRLALRLLTNSTQAREAVSLAAVISHLERRGELDGIIIVPVDAHPEIFGPSRRAEENGTRRCDLLLVRITQRSFKIECVEVKSRQEARVAQGLADHIVEQLQDTQRLLESLFFAADPPRIDAELQAARLSSLLHYYADRSMIHGLIEATRIADIHRLIDRIEETGDRPDISLKGYVISLGGDQGFKKKYGDVSLSVLTADDLGQLGLTTKRLREEEQFAAEEDRGAPIDQQIGAAPTSPEHGQIPEGEVAPIDGVTQTPNFVNGDKADSWDRDTRSGQNDTESNHTESQEADTSGGGSEGRANSESTSATPLEPPRQVEVVLGSAESGSRVTWRISTQGSPHAFVIGIPGQGKSVTTRKIIRDFASQGLPALVFDFHGDMAANPPQGAEVLDAALGLPFNPLEPDVGAGRPINVTAWEIAEVIGYVAKLGDIQRNHVYKALVNAYMAHGWEGTTPGEEAPALAEFAAAVEAVESGAKGKNARDRLRPFTDFGLFDEEASGHFHVLRQGRGLVVDVSKIGLEEVQRFAASFLLRRVYREMFTWGQTGELRLAVVLDEAHRLARDVTLPKIMKEGRKYGVAVVVASQSADDFHSDVLGNAGTKIVFRTNYPASKSVAGYLRGRSGLDLSQAIERLGVGVAYVSTPDDATARKVHMDE
jgi:DNA phosphorothioation-dependent restriction protein DptH